MNIVARKNKAQIPRPIPRPIFVEYVIPESPEGESVGTIEVFEARVIDVEVLEPGVAGVRVLGARVVGAGMLELDVVGIEVLEPVVESVDNENSVPIPVHVAVT